MELIQFNQVSTYSGSQQLPVFELSGKIPHMRRRWVLLLGPLVVLLMKKNLWVHYWKIY